MFIYEYIVVCVDMCVGYVRVCVGMCVYVFELVEYICVFRIYGEFGYVCV